jgi:membrane-associated phospholipid phosphatase
VEPLLSDRLAFLLTAALCASTFGATPAMAGDLPDVGAPAFSSRPYARLFDQSPSLPPLTQQAALSQQAAKEPPPPEPRHTGWGALARTTVGDFVAFPKRKSTWAILAIGGAAALAVHPWDDEINANAVEADGLRKFLKPGKYLGYGWVQGGAAVGLYLVGRYAMKPDVPGTHTNKMSHLGFDLLQANLVTQGLTYGIKYAVRRDRPTGECCAFPSGHASVTFATAAVLERHFGYRASWPMFLIAGYVSASRITDNRHFLSDVLFGAALGMASGWTVVGRHGKDNFTLVPAPIRGGVMLAGSWSPKPRGALGERR